MYIYVCNNNNQNCGYQFETEKALENTKVWGESKGENRCNSILIHI